MSASSRGEILANIVSLVPLDVRDAKTGDLESRGVWLNSYNFIRVHTKNNYDENSKLISTVVVKITLSLTNAPSHRHRDYKVSPKGHVSDRFWETVREHTKAQLAISSRAANYKQNIINSWPKIEPFVSTEGLKGGHAVGELKKGKNNSARIYSDDYGFKASFSVDLSGDIKLDSMHIENRYITKEQFDAIIAIVGLNKQNPKEVVVPSGELFDGI